MDCRALAASITDTNGAIRYDSFTIYYLGCTQIHLEQLTRIGLDPLTAMHGNKMAINSLARVLIVDDIKANRDILGHLVEAMGHQTCFAENGLNALAEIGKVMPDAVLLDLVRLRRS